MRNLFAAHRAEIERWSRDDAPRHHPLLRYYLATGDRAPVQVLDVPERFADRRVQARWRAWCASFHDADVSSQVALPVGAGPAPGRSFLVGRGERYGAAEMAFAARVHRVLCGLDRHLDAYACWSGRPGVDTAAAGEAAADLRLTPRELTVLDLLATGRTARAIAHRLGIAERTVEKHLGRVYTKLGVTDRLGAVLRAQRVGLLART